MLELKCFGQVTLTDEDGAEHVLRSRKHLGLLLYLVARARSTHPREDLSDLLWDGTGRRERHSLSQALYDIRSTVGDVVDQTSTTVRLVPDAVRYEVDTLERSVEGRDHEVALDVYRGDFAPELVGLGAEMFDRWLDGERERCRVLASIALRNAQRAAEERGQWDRMCLAALRLIRMNDYDEESHCALMRGLWMKGDPASALRHYRALDPDLVADWTSIHQLASRIEASGSVREVLTVPREPVDLMGREKAFGSLYDILRDGAASGALVLVEGEYGVGRRTLIREFSRLVMANAGDQRDAGADTAGVPRVRVTVAGEHQQNPEQSEPSPAPGELVLLPADRLVRVPDAPGTVVHVVRLERLAELDIRTAVASRLPRARGSAVEVAARLSDGNPKFAIAIARVIGEHRIPVSQATDLFVGREVLRRSAVLRDSIGRWQSQLSELAIEAARRVVCLQPPTVRALRDRGTECGFHQGLEELNRRNCIRDDPEGLELVPPIVAIALDDEAGVGFRKAAQLDAAHCLQGGSLHEQLAAARELAAAGQSRDAQVLAAGVSTLAIQGEEFGVASRAAGVAYATGITVSERFEAAKSIAAAELSRGRPRRAEQILRQVLHTAPDIGARIEAQLLLTRALCASDLLDDARRAVAEARRDLEAVVDARLSAFVRLAASETRFAARRSRGDQTSVARAADCLDGALFVSAVYASSAPRQWLDSLRSLFLYRASYESRASASSLLERHSKLLHSLAEHGGATLARHGRALLEIRAGRLRNAQSIVEDWLRDQPDRRDRNQAAALNNLGVTLIELGDFAAARRIFARLKKLDRYLGPPLVDELYTLINDAQAAWFMGDHRDVEKLTREAMERSEDGLENAPYAEAAALLAHSALDRGDEELARAMFNRTTVIPHESVGIHDRYLLEWLAARLQGGASAADRLREVADSIEPTDRLGSLKLRVISTRSQDSCRGVGQSAIVALRRSGAAWFVRTRGSHH